MEEFKGEPKLQLMMDVGLNELFEIGMEELVDGSLDEERVDIGPEPEETVDIGPDVDDHDVKKGGEQVAVPEQPAWVLTLVGAVSEPVEQLEVGGPEEAVAKMEMKPGEGEGKGGRCEMVEPEVEEPKIVLCKEVEPETVLPEIGDRVDSDPDAVETEVSDSEVGEAEGAVSEAEVLIEERVGATEKSSAESEPEVELRKTGKRGKKTEDPLLDNDPEVEESDLVVATSMYRHTTIGKALVDSLDELLEKDKVSQELALKILSRFDKKIMSALHNRLPRKNIVFSSARLVCYKYIHGIWHILLKNTEFRTQYGFANVDLFRIVATQGIAPNPYEILRGRWGCREKEKGKGLKWSRMKERMAKMMDA